MRHINDAGLRLLKEFEGCKLQVYKDIVGIPTVGYGHVTTLPVGTQITQKEAEGLLAEDLAKFEAGVDQLIDDFQVNINQFSALVCFAYNVGIGHLKNSTLLLKLKNREINSAASEFLRWNKAGGKPVAGLSRRRQAEKDLFLT